MSAMFDFLRCILRFPMPVRLWVGALMVVNGVFPAVFFGTIEGKLTLAAMILGALLQTVIFSKLGFVRFLGLGHVAWLALVPWIAIRIPDAAPGPFRNWMIALVVMNIGSLIIDASDVIRYVRGERDPQVTLD
jgi:hypothetical protein